MALPSFALSPTIDALAPGILMIARPALRRVLDLSVVALITYKNSRP